MKYRSLYVYDIDDTLILQEDIRDAMNRHRRKYGYVPKTSWLASAESLRDVQFNDVMRDVVEQSNADSYGRVVVISNRVETLVPAVKDMMYRLGVHVDDYLLRPVDKTSPMMLKSERLKHVLNQYSFDYVYVYDDDPRQLIDFESIRPYVESITQEYRVVHVTR